MDSYQLEWDQEKSLFQQMKYGNSEARNQLIEGNLGLVCYIVHQFKLQDEKEDLIQIGTIGLIKAIDTFDVNRNLKFSTYGSQCITNEILLFLRKNRKKISCISFESPIAKDESKQLTLKDVLYDQSIDLFSKIELECNRQEVREAISCLNDREQKVILLYFGFYQDRCYSQDEIAGMMGLSQSFVCRIIKKSLEKIKKRLICMEHMNNPYKRKKTVHVTAHVKEKTKAVS